MPPRIVKLGGRSFRELPISTIEHDLHFWRHARQAGLHEACLGDGESDEQLAARILGRMIDAGVLVELVADLLLPVEAEKWTPEIAAQTAAWIYGLDPAEDWTAMKGMVASLLAGFFAPGPISERNSRAPSREGAEVRPGA